METWRGGRVYRVAGRWTHLNGAALNSSDKMPPVLYEMGMSKLSRFLNIRNIFILFLLLSSSACSVPHTKSVVLGVGNTVQRELYTAELSYRGRQRIAGLLALRSERGVLDYSLLDSTGLKLLSGQVSLESDVVRGGVLKKSSLATYFGEIVKHIWLLEPKDRPCSTNGLLSFCSAEPSADYEKKVTFGPFTSWSVQRKGGDNLVSSSIYYRQPWADLEMQLRPVSEAEERSAQ